MPAQPIDNTSVQGNGTGDVLRTDAVTQDDGTTVKTPIVKVGVGAAHQAPRLVGEGKDAFPVHDRAVVMLLTEILTVLKAILAALQGPSRR